MVRVVSVRSGQCAVKSRCWKKVRGGERVGGGRFSEVTVRQVGAVEGAMKSTAAAQSEIRLRSKI